MGKYDKYAWAAEPEDIPAEQIVSTVEADAVIVGAGLSGVTAALSAAKRAERGAPGKGPPQLRPRLPHGGSQFRLLKK
jgi:NADH dehydrogenase FAD-containing subunit